MARMKALVHRYRLWGLAVFFLWIKTYLVYKIGFKITSDNGLQEFLFFINPLSSAIFIIGLSLFFRRGRHLSVLLLSFLATLVLYFNLLYYRFFSDFLTLPVLLQTSNANDLSSSITELIVVSDFLLFADIIILAFLIYRRTFPVLLRGKFEAVGVLFLALVLFIFNICIVQFDREQPLLRSYDRELIVKNIGVFNYHLYDALVQSQSKAMRVLADSSDISTVENYTKINYKRPNEDFFGIAKGKNIIVLSLESLQSFVINETINGEEITPFLNQLIKESYYFSEFYHQTAQGKTSDSEFLLENSQFPRDSGAVFFTHADNIYDGLPTKLKEVGYFTSVMHANEKSFWNRDEMYEALGYEKFYDIEYYTIQPDNSAGWGLKDVDFFQQSLQYLALQPKPFYTKLITLTNHFPFKLGEEDYLIEEYHSTSGTFNRYFPTVRYMDRAVEVFFEDIKKTGLYEESIFILFGDHYGISENHYEAMAPFLNKQEITDFDHVQLQRVPLFIHIPGISKGETISTVSGQVDLRPTILHLLGMGTKNELHFGADLFSKERQSFAVLRDGSFITDEYVYTKERCYEKKDGTIVDDDYCKPFLRKAENDLMYSDKLLYGDLLRFKNN